MIRTLTRGIAAASLMLVAAPTIAQEEPEQARTTYELRFIDLSPGSEGAFLERLDKYFNPAREAAGMQPAQVHFLHNGDYDLLLVLDMPGGMGTFDTHAPATGLAFRAALLELAGSEEALEKLNKDGSDLVSKTKSIYSHTHP